MSTILVTAANGSVGRHLVPRLLAAGHTVRAASRSGAAEAGTPVRFDFRDPASVAAALAGADAAYLVMPSGETDPVELLAPVIEAAQASRTKVVLQSAIGVDSDENIPFRKLERVIEASGLPFVILRPNWFSDNFHNLWIKGIRDHGTIALPAGDARTSFIDARDIADAAVVALTTDRFDGGSYVLTGADSLTYAEAALVLAAVAGRPIRYDAVDGDTFVALAPQTGVPDAYARYLTAIFHPVALGYVAADTGDVEKLTGRPPRPFADYAAENAARFR